MCLSEFFGDVVTRYNALLSLPISKLTALYFATPCRSDPIIHDNRSLEEFGIYLLCDISIFMATLKVRCDTRS